MLYASSIPGEPYCPQFLFAWKAYLHSVKRLVIVLKLGSLFRSQFANIARTESAELKSSPFTHLNPVHVSNADQKLVTLCVLNAGIVVR